MLVTGDFIVDQSNLSLQEFPRKHINLTLASGNEATTLKELL
jgi:hypothetical protein